MESVERQQAKVGKRKSGATGQGKAGESVGGAYERDEVVVLKNESPDWIPKTDNCVIRLGS